MVQLSAMRANFVYFLLVEWPHFATFVGVWCALAEIYVWGIITLSERVITEYLGGVFC